MCRQELGGPAAAGPRLPSPSPPAQLGLLRPSSDGELSRGKVEPREPRPTPHTFAPGQKGRGRGRSAGWVRAAASGGGSVDSWNRLLEGFALDRGSCQRAAQDPGKRRFPQTLSPIPLGYSESWGNSTPGNSEKRSLMKATVPPHG